MACVVNPGIPDNDIRTLHLGACRQPNATSVTRSLLLCADHEDANNGCFVLLMGTPKLI